MLLVDWPLVQTATYHFRTETCHNTNISLPTEGGIHDGKSSGCRTAAARRRRRCGGKSCDTHFRAGRFCMSSYRTTCTFGLFTCEQGRMHFRSLFACRTVGRHANRAVFRHAFWVSFCMAFYRTTCQQGRFCISFHRTICIFGLASHVVP